MRSRTVRVREETHRKLAAMARERGESIPELLARLVDRAEDDALLAAANARFSEMRETGELEDYTAEHREWEDATVEDGLEGLD
jgi:predicted CopG family antitoxin